MLFAYPAIFHQEDNSFWVEFPDLQGCQTFADTLNEAVECSQEALGAYLLTLLEDNKPVPCPSDIKLINADPNGFTSLVSCQLNATNDMKSVKKTLTIPTWLNERALSLNINFSKVLQDALLEKVQR